MIGTTIEAITAEAITLEAPVAAPAPPVEALYTVGIITLAVIFALLILLLLFSFRGEREEPRRRPRTPEEIALELQHQALKRMEAAHWQNWVLIIITIISLLVLIFGGEATIRFVRERWTVIAPWIESLKNTLWPKILEFFKFK